MLICGCLPVHDIIRLVLSLTDHNIQTADSNSVTFYLSTASYHQSFHTNSQAYYTRLNELVFI